MKQNSKYVILESSLVQNPCIENMQLRVKQLGLYMLIFDQCFLIN